MIIRVATEDDAEAISHLWRELMDYHQQLDQNMPTPATDGAMRYEQRIRYGVSDSYIQTYVADDDGDIVGYVYATIIDLLPEMFASETAGMIGDIYVKADYRSQGVGTKLMQAMKDWFKLRGAGHYEWYVAAANAEGIAFWEKKMHGVPVMTRMRASVDD